MAVNCWVSPAATEAVAGETVMPTKTAGVTTRAAVPDRVAEGSLAVMVTAPVDTPVAKPWEPEALEMVAEDEDDDQVTESVRF